MGTVELDVVLDDRSATYHPGDAITGHVELSVEGDDVRGDLRATLLWECHGRYIEHRGVVEQIDAIGDARRWAPGSHAVALRFECPAAPVSYEGEFFDVDLVVRVELRLDEGLPVEATLEVRSVLGPDHAPRISVIEEPPPELRLGENRWDAMIEDSVRESPLRQLPGLAGRLVRFADGLAELLTGKHSASKRISNLELEYEPGAGTILVRLDVKTRSEKAPTALEATLGVYECAVRRGRSGRRVERLGSARGLLERTTEERAQGVRYEGAVELPDGVALSFECGGGAIRWNLRVADPHGWMVRSFPLRAHL